MKASSLVLRFLVLLSAVLPMAAHAATLTVNSIGNDIADDGVCTLHEAIVAANTDTASGVMPGECASGSGADQIAFSVAGTIQPVEQLPDIVSVIHIDGYSAPGSSKNTLPLGQGTNAVLTIEIDGVNAGNVPGFRLQGAGAVGSIIEGLVINKSGGAQCCNTSPFQIAGVNGVNTETDTIIRGNFIGTSMSGSERRSTGSRGILIWQNSGRIIVGSDRAGFDPAAVNLISGNGGAGVDINGVDDLVVRGNLVGTDATGTVSLGNTSGVGGDSFKSTLISDNLISGNSGFGIVVRQQTSGVTISNNKIGTNVSGTGAIPNSLGGIRILDNFNSTPTSITDIQVSENTIAFNLCSNCSGGIIVGQSNSNNTIVQVYLSQNLIHSNQGLEIDLAPANETDSGPVFGITPNDPDDADSGGPNNLQNFPVVDSAKQAGTEVTIAYSLVSEPEKMFSLEFFHTSACDDSGHGGAEDFLGQVDALTNASGDVSGEVVLGISSDTGFITATASHPDNGSSEFSVCTQIESETIHLDGFESK